MFIGIVFVVLGLIFTFSMVRSSVNLISHDWGEEGFSMASLIKFYSVSLLSLVALILFIVFYVPKT